jgi:tetratricopeptide (TPR) repeat protein
MRRCVAFSCAAALLLAAPVEAWADADGARQHFEAGKKLRDDGDCVRAIVEFDRSLNAERSIGAYYNLAYCHEQLGHRQDAYDAYKQAQQLASSKKDERLREISGALASLLEAPHVRLVLPQPLPDGLQIKVDDQSVPTALYQTETVIFTKSHKYHAVIVTAPGYEERRENVETKQLKVIELHRPPATRPETVASPPGAHDGGWTWQNWTGLGMAVAGAGVFTVGAVVGVSYMLDESRLLSTFKAACQTDGRPECTPAEAQAQRFAKANYEENERSGEDNALLIVGTLVGGGLLIGGGLVVYLTAPKATTQAGLPRLVPIIDASRQGFALHATF